MQRIQRKAFMGLVVLGLVGAVPAMAQDTTNTQRTPEKQGGLDSLTMPGQGGAADTAGFSGMERNDPTGARAPGAEQDTAGARQDTSGVETGAVRTENQSDTSANAQRSEAGQSRDPNGYRWTEPSDWARAGQTPPVGATDAVQPKHQNQQDQTGQAGQGTDSTKWGRPVDTTGVQNPEGFRGLERPAGVDSAMKAGDTTGAADATSRTEQMKRQDQASDDQNPPGYRGMEKPAGEDTHKQHADSTKKQ